MMTDAVWRLLAIVAVLAAALFGVQAWTGTRLKLMYRPGDPIFLPSDETTQKFHAWTAVGLVALAVVFFVVSIVSRPS